MPDIELKKIQPNRLNPRLEFTKAGLDELSDSIKRVGLLEPIIVRQVGNQFEVVVGERRYRAAQQAGLHKVPVIIRHFTDEEVMELNLIENIQREELSAVEKGNVCKQLMDTYPSKYPTKTVLASAIGVNPKRVEEWLAMTSVPVEIQSLVAPKNESGRIPSGKIGYDVALHLQRTRMEPERQIEVAQEFAKKPVPQRMYRQIVKEVARESDKPISQVFHEVIEEAPITLPFSKAHADAILKQVKTQTSRKTKDPRLQKGVNVRAQVTYFADLEVTDVYRKKLGDFDEEDAKREGGYTLDEFKEVWKELHGEWNPNESLYIIQFRLMKVVGETSDSK